MEKQAKLKMVILDLKRIDNFIQFILGPKIKKDKMFISIKMLRLNLLRTTDKTFSFVLE